MSQTTLAPSPSFSAWYSILKQAFGFDAVGKQARTAQEGLDKRLKTLTLTAIFAKSQPPDVAIRTLQGVLGELEMVHDAIEQADGVGLSGKALVLKKNVTEALEKVSADALNLTREHADGWLGEASRLLDKSTPRPNPTDRAKLLLSLFNKLEMGVDADTTMLRLVGTNGSAVLDPVKIAAATLREEYLTLMPVRLHPLLVPTQPARAAPRPQLELGDLAPNFGRNLATVEAAMSKNEQPDIAALDEVIDILKRTMDVTTATEDLLRFKTWNAVKGEYKRLTGLDPGLGKAFMAKMWWFRRLTVDEKMAELQKKYDFVWGSVGSANLESDYDVTVRTHGTLGGKVYYDYQIVEEFNLTVSKPFGNTPPGILFDTNLYAEAMVKPTWDQFTPIGHDMGAMCEQGQDVGALMKLRRFMSWDDYEDYKQKTLAGMPKENRPLMLRQFEEADSLFFIAIAEQLEEAKSAEEQPVEKGMPAEKPATSQQDQRDLLQKAEALEHDEAKAMAVNNALYLRKIEEVRKLEQALMAEENVDKKSALLAKLRTLQADATFFAAEAYHSEGPLMHVVQAGQSSRIEVNNDLAFADVTQEARNAEIKIRTDAKLAGYTPTQMLQSFNENLGDLLKDLKHYGSEPFPGLGFYRSSKYLERLCEAAALLTGKLDKTVQEKFAAIQIGGKTPAAVRSAVAGLVDIRGEKKVFEGLDDPEQEKQAYAIEEMGRIFPGVKTLPDLARVAMTFGQQVNAQVRAAEAKRMTAGDEKPYFQATGT